MKKKHWYDYLWIYAIIYFALGFFLNVLQAPYMVCILPNGNHDTGDM